MWGTHGLILGHAFLGKSWLMQNLAAPLQVFRGECRLGFLLQQPRKEFLKVFLVGLFFLLKRYGSAVVEGTMEGQALQEAVLGKDQQHLDGLQSRASPPGAS